MMQLEPSTLCSAPSVSNSQSLTDSSFASLAFISWSLRRYYLQFRLLKCLSSLGSALVRIAVAQGFNLHAIALDFISWALRRSYLQFRLYKCLSELGSSLSWSLRSVYQKTIPTLNVGFFTFGHSPCSSLRVQRVNASANCVHLAYFFFLLKYPTSAILNWSPNLSSSSWFLMYSAIRLVFLPTVST